MTWCGSIWFDSCENRWHTNAYGTFHGVRTQLNHLSTLSINFNFILCTRHIENSQHIVWVHIGVTCKVYSYRFILWPAVCPIHTLCSSQVAMPKHFYMCAHNFHTESKFKRQNITIEGEKMYFNELFVWNEYVCAAIVVGFGSSVGSEMSNTNCRKIWISAEHSSVFGVIRVHDNVIWWNSAMNSWEIDRCLTCNVCAK